MEDLGYTFWVLAFPALKAKQFGTNYISSGPLAAST